MLVLRFAVAVAYLVAGAYLAISTRRRLRDRTRATFAWSFIAAGAAAGGRITVPTGDPANAGALVPLGLELLVGLLDGQGRHDQPLGELAQRRQALTGDQGAEGDALRDLPGDLAGRCCCNRVFRRRRRASSGHKARNSRLVSTAIQQFQCSLEGQLHCSGANGLAVAVEQAPRDLHFT